MTKVYVKAGDKVQLECPYSEVCMHLGIAGKEMIVELLCTNMTNYHSVQLYKPETPDEKFSFPIGTGEAGLYLDWGGYYYHKKDFLI